MLLALFAVEAALVIWMQEAFSWNWVSSLGLIALFDVVLAGFSLRIGGQLAKGPYLPETLEGLARTTKAVLGRS